MGQDSDINIHRLFIIIDGSKVFDSSGNTGTSPILFMYPGMSTNPSLDLATLTSLDMYANTITSPSGEHILNRSSDKLGEMGNLIGYARVLRNIHGDPMGVIGVQYKSNILVKLIDPLIRSSEFVTYFVYEIN